MALCDPGRDPNRCWEEDCPCGGGCDEFTRSDDGGKHGTKCYKVKFGRCNGLKCEIGAVPGTYEVGFRIVDPTDPNYGTGAAAGTNYRCMEVSADWREKMCCGERGWRPGSAFPGGGSKCDEDPDTPDNPGDGDDGGGGPQQPVPPVAPPVNPNLPPVTPPGWRSTGATTTSTRSGRGQPRLGSGSGM